MSVAFLIAGLVLLTALHELGHAAAARALGMHISVVSVGFGPPVVHFRVREADVLFCVIPFGGFVRVEELSGEASEAEVRKVGLAKKLVVTLAGSSANYLIAAAIGVGLALGWGVDTGRTLGLEVTMVSEHAAQAGLAPGDVVLRADGAHLQSVEQLQAAFTAAGARPVRLELLRAAETREVFASAAGPGRSGLGARYVPKPELLRVGLLSAAAHGLVDPLRKASAMLVSAGRWLTPAKARRPVSPVGLASRVAQSGRWDARRVLTFAGLLSVVVGLFNLLPIPGLDGGRVCIAVGEAVLRRRLASRVALAIQLTGALILFAAWIVIVVFDVLALGR
ncbi:MAG: site-2 protease family protein [Deltaproteobacteria bacterium]|nr:site-2 protease family protein [Deltaproteobacteria bacterium]